MYFLFVAVFVSMCAVNVDDLRSHIVSCIVRDFIMLMFERV